MNNLIGEHGVFRGGRKVGTVTAREEGLTTVISCSCDLQDDGVLRLAGVSNDEFVSIGVVAPDMGRLRLKKSFTKNALNELRLDEQTNFYLILPGETIRDLKATEDTPALKLTLGARPALTGSEPEPETEQEILPEPECGFRPEEAKQLPPKIARGLGGPPIPKIPPAVPPPEAPENESPPSPPQTAPHEKKPDIPDKVVRAADDTASGTGQWRPIRDPASLFSDGDIQQACKNARGALATEREGFLMLAIPVTGDEPFPMMPVFCFGTSETIGGDEYIVFKTKNGNLAV